MNPIIANAISRGWHNTKDERLGNQTWETFDAAQNGRKLFLFGVGDGLEYFYDTYRKRYAIEGVIDNDARKQGIPIDAYVTIQRFEADKDIIISGIKALKAYDSNTIMVLITSLRYYQEIAQQLEREGIRNYFALLPMEANLEQAEDVREETIQAVLEGCQEQPIEDKKIVISIGGYGGHGKAITGALLRIRPDLDIVWITDDLTMRKPNGVRLVYRKDRKKYLHEMSTAKVWVDEHIVPGYLTKRSGQIYIQVKHWSSITLKSFGLKLYQFRKDRSGEEEYLHNAKMMDYIFVGSPFDEQTCREGFGFEGETVYVGSPRSDVLFQKDKEADHVFRHYALDTSDRILLYAPTFRYKEGTSDVHEAYCDIDFAQLYRAVKETFHGDWKILLRLHPLVALEQKKLKLPDYVIPASDYDDSQELVAASDVLITDYSSIMFEPAFVGKPVFLYAPDRRKYIDGERELLIDYDSLPFPIAETNEGLTECIKVFDAARYEKTVREFLDSYGVHEDGHAAERAAVFIADLMV